ncbi:FtsB family cell division protein [Oceanicaulis sp.]|uniref:FtsB family cell division protein n=1 Tax=Oceanicaulis sp. TaxID=1924941 RepID=UPI003F700238
MMKVLKRFIPLIGLALVIGYLSYHALHGEQGYLNHLRIQAQISAAEAELAEVRQTRQHMEDRVARLKVDGPDGSVDVDYLEERARAVLRFAHPDEIVVQIDRGAQPEYGG